MGKSFRRLMPLWITYVLLLALSVAGPIMSQQGGLARGHWVFLFLMPFAIGCVPLGFILGEIIQRRTRSSGRSAWRLGLFHSAAMYAIFIVGVFDMLLQNNDFLYYVIWLAPSLLSGLFFVLGMFVMRAEMTRSDARYGVEVSRGDPWAPFFDLEWEEGSPRTLNVDTGIEDEEPDERRPRRRRKLRRKRKEASE